jgi:hypothetical protein
MAEYEVYRAKLAAHPIHQVNVRKIEATGAIHSIYRAIIKKVEPELQNKPASRLLSMLEEQSVHGGNDVCEVPIRSGTAGAQSMRSASMAWTRVALSAGKTQAASATHSSNEATAENVAKS